ncbi:MAG: gliding motility-associated C-terminal domain-containing protein [Crocinitomicaceae bacterium]
MSKVLSVLFILIGVNSFQQNNWLDAFGGFTNEEIIDVAVDPSGNIISVGYISGTLNPGTGNVSTNGNTDIFVIKTDEDGDVLWAVNAGGTGPDRGEGICVDAAGDIYITGYYHTSATFGIINVAGQNREAFVAKIDAAGTFQWVTSMGGEFGDAGFGVQVDNAGNVYATGEYIGNGVFGSDVFASLNGSYDVFVTKLDPTGAFIWTKDGKATQDDRGVSLDIDAANNVYVVGSFSESITFDNLHNNTALNAGFIVAFDANGNELWLDMVKAAQVALTDVEVSASSLYITGDYKGNLSVIDINNTTSFPTTSEYNILVSKLTTAGDLTWLSSSASDNELFSNQIAIDPSNDVYIAGTFKCTYHGMNSIYGESTFRSVGFKDVHFQKYNNSGVFQWGRQLGGTADDNCTGLAIGLVDEPILAGSFEEVINIPTGSAFNFQPGQFVGAVITNENCGDAYYDNFARETALGAKDMFLTNPFDINRLPYDYYLHPNSSCDYDTILPCINDCSDLIEFCEGTALLTFQHFQQNSGLRPDYDYLWSNGSSGFFLIPPSDGTYFIDITSEDGCYSWTDTIDVIIHPNPSPPAISDAWNINSYTIDPEGIDTCGNDTLYLWATPSDLITVDVTWDLGIPVNDSTIQADGTGTYVATATSAAGCTATSSIEVVLDTFALTEILDPHIAFVNPDLQATDSILICSYENIEAYIIDSTFLDLGATPNKFTVWYLDGNLIDTIFHFTPDTFGVVTINPPDTGWFNLTAHFFNECGDSVLYEIQRDFHVLMVPDPTVVLSGPPIGCLGDTVIVHADYFASAITWTAQTMVANYTDSIAVLMNTSPLFIIASVDTTVEGKTCSANAVMSIVLDAQPVVSIFPTDGYICPGDSVMLNAIDGVAWEWIDPFGDSIGNTQQIYVQQSGNYFANITLPSGCTLSSNFVTTIDYSSPYLELLTPTICEGQSTTMEVFGPPSTVINWYAPLTGTQTIQTVQDAGTYYVETSFCGITKLDSVTVFISEVDPSLNFTGDTTICPSDIVTIEAIPGYDYYEWNGVPGTATFQASQPGIYLMEAENSFGCTAVSDTITIIHYPIPPAPIAIDTFVCLNGDITLQASGQGDLLWYQNGNYLQTSDSLELTDVTSDLTYTLVNADTTCPSPQTIFNLTIYQGSITPIISGPSSICEGDSLVLHCNQNDPNVTYNWTGPNLTNSDSIFIINPVQMTDDGTYSLNFSDQYCTSETSTFDLEVIQTDLPITIDYLAPCEGDSISITLNPQTFNAYYWIKPTGGIFSTLTTVVLPTSDLENLEFRIVVNNDGCISDTTYHDILVHPNPVSTLPTDTVFCMGEEVLTYHPDYSLVSEMQDHPENYYDSLLIITYSDEFGCETTDSVNVTFQECNLTEPNIFTPNGDGVNDSYFFTIDKGEILQFVIVNRWGRTIYESYDNYWDGTDFNGDPVTEGWYYYILYYEDFSFESAIDQGTIFLNR